jgi:hypothetical protein
MRGVLKIDKKEIEMKLKLWQHNICIDVDDRYTDNFERFVEGGVNGVKININKLITEDGKKFVDIFSSKKETENYVNYVLNNQGGVGEFKLCYSFTNCQCCQLFEEKFKVND